MSTSLDEHTIKLAVHFFFRNSEPRSSEIVTNQWTKDLTDLVLEYTHIKEEWDPDFCSKSIKIDGFVATKVEFSSPSYTSVYTNRVLEVGKLF